MWWHPSKNKFWLLILRGLLWSLSMSFQEALQEAIVHATSLFCHRNASRFVLYTTEKNQPRRDAICFLRSQRFSLWRCGPLLESMWGGRDCLSQGGQETEEGCRKRPGQPIAPKNKPLCDLLPLGRPHLLNFIQPSKIMPPARYWKFCTRDGERQWPIKFKVKGGQKMIARNVVFPNHYF